MWIDHQMSEDNHCRNEGKKINPACSPREEVSSHFHTSQAPRLYPPEAPWLLHEMFLKVGKPVASQRTPVRADQILIDGIGIIVGRRDRLDLD